MVNLTSWMTLTLGVRPMRIQFLLGYSVPEASAEYANLDLFAYQLSCFKILEDKIERILNARKKIQIRMTIMAMPLMAK